MKLIIIILLVCLLILPISSAANITTNITNTSANITNITPTQTIIQNITPFTTPNIKYLPEEFYGNLTYSDGSPIPSGSKIEAMNQHGKIIGTFNTTISGSYGDDYKSAPRLLIYAENMDDDITFYVNGIKSTTSSRVFDSSTIKRNDIILPASAKILLTPTINSTPVVTQNLTLPTRTIVPTPVPTPVPTSVPTPVPTSVPTIKPTVTPSPQSINDTTIKFLGILFIAIAICVFGALITYFILTKKMKRDDEDEILL